MTLSLDRTAPTSPKPRRRVTWITVVGVLLLPVLLGGILVAALYNPADRLGNISAAIVNDDEPVTIDDQVVPLGRQLTAGLVEGSDDVPSNVDWTISNADDAAEGLADGTYTAVVTIPAGFSAAATSTAPGGTPVRATIDVQTAPDARVVDDAITTQITQAAASILGTTLSEAFLDNVFLGFTTLGDQLGEAASGARQLADGAALASSGAGQLPAGATGLADGASQLSGGAGQLATGLDQLAAGARGSRDGASQLSTTISGVATSVAAPDLVSGADEWRGFAKQAGTDTADVATTLGAALQTYCTTPTPADPSLCGAVSTALSQATTAATSAGTSAAYADPTADGVAALTSQTSAGLSQIAGGAGSLASGLGQLAGGIDQSASGARDLSSGASSLSTGAGSLATGAQSLADGVSGLATGTSDLADGLETAVAQIPSYSDAEAQSLADVVADPVTATGSVTGLFGASAIPLLAVLVLWVGALGTFVALRATPARVLASRAPSIVLALRALAPAAAIGAAQGLLVAIVVQIAASYDLQQWTGFALVCVAAGVAFAAVNQALLAVLRGAGRWVAALIAVLAVATGVVSTVPGVLAQLAALLPTDPAYRAMLAILTDVGGLGAGVAGLAVWTVLSVVATTLAVARGRTTSVAALRAASAPA